MRSGRQIVHTSHADLFDDREDASCDAAPAPALDRRPARSGTKLLALVAAQSKHLLEALAQRGRVTAREAREPVSPRRVLLFQPRATSARPE